jgi:predicted naringenin-chalcone synthase
MSFAILGLGTATPSRSIAQVDAANLAASFANAEPGRERTLAAIYRQTRIQTRGSVLLEEPGDDQYRQTFFPPADMTLTGPSTATRMRRFSEESAPLAIEAARSGLERAGVAAEAVSHLVTCSCTGFASPGFDLALVESLGLSRSVARTHVGFMGCHGAFNAMKVAAAFAAADAGATVLAACVELCSLHFQYGARADDVVANAIFADGAAAVVGRTVDDAVAAGGWRLTAQASCILPASADLMGWTIGDHGFSMTLSPRVPDRIASELCGVLESLLANRGLKVSDVASWAVHPGGPRVLATVREALGLGPAALACSEAVLAEHGNMSSATILFILERLVRDHAARPCVAMAFGPGLTAELALFE